MLIKTAGNAGLFLAEYSMPPAFAGPPAHIHEEMDHSFYVVEGSVRFVIGGEETNAGAGSFIYIPRNVVHAFGNPSGSPNRFLEINVPGGFENYYRELAEAFPPGSSLDPSRMYEIQQRHKTRPA
jgi:mannose-6-phosphate isomerase-like protein (cupin superfamily)